MSQSKLGRTIARYELWITQIILAFKAVTTCNGFQFPSSFQLRPSLRKLSAANSSAFRVLVQASQASDVGSIPVARSITPGSSPDTWVTQRTDYIGNTFGPNGFSSGSNTRVSR